MSKSIFKLYTFEYDPKDSYPKEVSVGDSGEAYAYSSIEKALENMKEDICQRKEYNKEDKTTEFTDGVAFYQIAEYILDTWEGDNWIYNNEGILLSHNKENEEFFGNDNPKYKEDDIVEFYYCKEVGMGKITATPPDKKRVSSSKMKFCAHDNSYLIDTLDGDTNKHSHVQEVFIMRKIGVLKKED